MIDSQVLLTGVFMSALLTGLVTEAVKKVLDEHKHQYQANSLAGVIAVVVSIALGVGYVVLSEIAFSAQIVVYLIALMGSSWLCAMVGYDKVIQTIEQFTKTEK
jgi:hypothetical protein